jgi:hypothetical protein
MVEHLYPNFLHDQSVYADVEQFWINLWERIDATVRDGWQTPWFEPLPPSISEGNPIFSAVSPSLKRGIRVLQSEPTEKGLEFMAYPDTFGGSIFDPSTIHELVISCALSDEADRIARSLIVRWIEGKPIESDRYEAGLIALDGSRVERIYSDCLFPEADLIISNGFTNHRFSATYVGPAHWKLTG